MLLYLLRRSWKGVKTLTKMIRPLMRATWGLGISCYCLPEELLSWFEEFISPMT